MCVNGVRNNKGELGVTLNLFIAIMPSIVGILYTATAIAYAIKGDYAYSVMWGSYALANVALVMIGLRS